MRIKSKIIILFTSIIIMCLSSFPVLAQDKPEGTLISSECVNYSDGTSSVENIYIQVPNPLHSSLFAVPGKLQGSTYGSDTFTKTKNWYSGLNGNGSLIVSAQVTASFDWNSSTKKVKVYNAEGEVTDDTGGDISNEKITTSGNNTSKAKATFSFKRTTNLGFSNNYSISLSCNSKGTDS